MSEIYLWDDQRKQCSKQLTEIKEAFFERIEPIFANAEQEADKCAEDAWENVMQRPMSEEEYDSFDPDIYVDYATDKGIEKYALLTNMGYRLLVMWISLLCQVWEQQLLLLVINSARNYGIKYKDSDFKKGFGFIQEVFKKHKYDLTKMKCWSKIKEMRALVNVIKHTEGDSANTLRTLRPDYFTKYGVVDSLKLYRTSLLDITLAVENKDFVDYCDALLAFWSELPDVMISK